MTSVHFLLVVTLRRRWNTHVWHTKQMCIESTLKDLGIAESAVSEWILQNHGGRKWAGFLRVRVQSKEIHFFQKNHGGRKWAGFLRVRVRSKEIIFFSKESWWQEVGWFP